MTINRFVSTCSLFSSSSHEVCCHSKTEALSHYCVENNNIKTVPLAKLATDDEQDEGDDELEEGDEAWVGELEFGAGHDGLIQEHDREGCDPVEGDGRDDD